MKCSVLFHLPPFIPTPPPTSLEGRGKNNTHPFETLNLVHNYLTLFYQLLELCSFTFDPSLSSQTLSLTLLVY